MKWSTVLEVASMGMRVTAVQVTPSIDVLYTRSFVEQLAGIVRKRQSSHTTQTVPAPSTAADGKGPLRIPPASLWTCMFEIVPGALQLSPPLLETKADMRVVKPVPTPTSVSIGTTTVPFGCTRGWPPIPWARFAVGVGGPQVSPPSTEVLIKISSVGGSSHSR